MTTHHPASYIHQNYEIITSLENIDFLVNRAILKIENGSAL